MGYDNGSFAAAAIPQPRRNEAPAKKGWVFKYMFGFLAAHLDSLKLAHVPTPDAAAKVSLFKEQSDALAFLQNHTLKYGNDNGTYLTLSLVEHTITGSKIYERTDFKWFGVDSSLAEQVGYSRVKRALAVEMQSGEVYVYENVNESMMANALFGDSFGSYYNTYIKGKYPSVKL